MRRSGARAAGSRTRPGASLTPPAHHRDTRLVLLVAAGGAVGTGLRHAVTSAVPSIAGWPLPTLAVNVAGTFLLGVLLEALLRPGTESARARTLRLGLGTGLLGGLTTFSSLAVELERLLAGGAPAVAAGYAAASVALGLAACAAGVAVGARVRPRAAGRVA